MLDTSQSLLERLSRDPHESASWERLVDVYGPFLRRWCRRLADLSAPNADDVVQSVLTVLVRRLPIFVHNQRVNVVFLAKKGLGPY